MLKNLLADSMPPDSGRKDKIFLALNLLIPALVGMYIFANPLPLAVINEICFYLSCAALIVLLIFRKTDFTLHSPMTLPFALFLLWSVFGLFFALDLKNSVHDLRGHLLEYLILFYLLVNFFSTRKKLEILSLILIAGATVFSVGGMIVFYIIEGFPLSERMGLTFKEMQTGYSSFITILAAVLAIRCFHEYKPIAYKVIFSVCFLVNVAAALLTQTRSAFIGLILALVILCFINKRNIIFILMFLIVLVTLAVTLPGMRIRLQDLSFKNDVRSQMYRLSLEVIKDHPIVGIGFGMQTYSNKDLVPLEDYNRRLPPQYQQQGIIINSPHNTFLDITLRTGVVGLILFLSIILTAIGMLWIIYKRNKKDEYFRSWVIYLFAGFVSYIIGAMFVDAAFGPRVVLFYTILAIVAILWNLSKKSESLVP